MNREGLLLHLVVGRHVLHFVVGHLFRILVALHHVVGCLGWHLALLGLLLGLLGLLAVRHFVARHFVLAHLFVFHLFLGDRATSQPQHAHPPPHFLLHSC